MSNHYQHTIKTQKKQYTNFFDQQDNFTKKQSLRNINQDQFSNNEFYQQFLNQTQQYQQNAKFCGPAQQLNSHHKQFVPFQETQYFQQEKIYKFNDDYEQYSNVNQSTASSEDEKSRSASLKKQDAFAKYKQYDEIIVVSEGAIIFDNRADQISDQTSQQSLTFFAASTFKQTPVTTNISLPSFLK